MVCLSFVLLIVGVDASPLLWLAFVQVYLFEGFLVIQGVEEVMASGD